MKSICSDSKLNGKFIHSLNCLWRQDFGQLYLWHLVWFLSVWIFFMVDPANPLRWCWCWCWWWRWHGRRWWGWCKGRNGQTSWTFFLSTPFLWTNFSVASSQFTGHSLFMAGHRLWRQRVGHESFVWAHLFSDVHKTWARQRDLSETPKSQSLAFNFWETLTFSWD